jgi:hypothetical protein
MVIALLIARERLETGAARELHGRAGPELATADRDVHTPRVRVAGSRGRASRKRPRTLAGRVSDGAAFVLPTGHLLALDVAAPTSGGRLTCRRGPALLASAHRNPHLADECGLPARSMHMASLALRRKITMGCGDHFRLVALRDMGSSRSGVGCAT